MSQAPETTAAARGDVRLVEDIKPTPIKERASLGVVELKLGPDQIVRCVGVVYGLEHEISGPGFKATLFLDQYNQRIKLLSYEATDYRALILSVRYLAEENGFDKIIVMAAHDDWQRFLAFGYVLEAVIRYYHRGQDAFVVSKFRSQERLTSACLMDETLLIEKLMSQPRPERHRSPLPPGVELRMAKQSDFAALIELYSEIFATYPSPLIHASYLQTVFQKESLFAVCVENGRIIAAASAERHHAALSAELTDCATRPEARGRGLMSHLLYRLERELVDRQYISAFTMARARSYGMNAVFYQLGYTFMGRLMNNCDIYGAYEDMNIWVRKLDRASIPGLSEAPPPQLTAKPSPAHENK